MFRPLDGSERIRRQPGCTAIRGLTAARFMVAHTGPADAPGFVVWVSSILAALAERLGGAERR